MGFWGWIKRNTYGPYTGPTINDYERWMRTGGWRAQAFAETALRNREDKAWAFDEWKADEERFRVAAEAFLGALKRHRGAEKDRYQEFWELSRRFGRSDGNRLIWRGVEHGNEDMSVHGVVLKTREGKYLAGIALHEGSEERFSERQHDTEKAAIAEAQELQAQFQKQYGDMQPAHELTLVRHQIEVQAQRGRFDALMKKIGSAASKREQEHSRARRGWFRSR